MSNPRLFSDAPPPSWRRRWNTLVRLRDDNMAQLRSFLAGGGAAAGIANLALNIGCKVARMFRTSSPHPIQPASPLCAIIAETTISQCLHYRVQERAVQLSHLGWRADYCDWRDFFASRQLMELSSCVIFYRVPMIGHVEALFDEARRLGIPVLFDIDDLIFDRELYEPCLDEMALPAAEKQGLLELADMYRKSMEASDKLLASTPVLTDALQRVAPEGGTTVPNTISDALLQMTAAIPDRSLQENSLVRMFYGSGSPTHDKDFALIAEALEQALEADPRLNLTVFGHLRLPPSLAAHPRVHRIGFLDKDTYYRTIADYDIALMPLVPSLFNDAKSNIKYLEASVFEIPSIVSPRADFLEIVCDGENALVARDTEQWRDAILKLAASPELRREMGRRARESVRERYSCAHVAETALHQLLPALPTETNSPRILLVNVLFGEISFGGATVVVEDTARELARQGFDVHVFCAGRADGFFPTEMKRYVWNGISVVMVCDLPQDKDEREQAALLTFRRVLDNIQPHVVHFHSIHDFGLGIIQECRHRAIPYLLTFHDAWSLCSRQFMLDTAGNYCNQTRVLPEICIERCTLQDEAVCRRRIQMAEALADAAFLLAPSDFQTSFLKCNFPQYAHKCCTNRNGIRRPPAQRRRRDGPLRFGFLGGKAAHKGYFFLAQALHSLKRTDFELLLVDVHTVFGSGLLLDGQQDELWHDLPVCPVPFVPHESIDELYADIDVLLFPSLGKESFGLTIREAIIRDIFVISSECGGPCEAIRPGKNGLLFPMGDMEAFCQHLHFVLDNKEKFISYTTTDIGDIIDTETQVQELAAIYREMIPAPQ